MFSRSSCRRDEHGQPLSRKQIRDHVLSLLIAGHETTANALAWSLHLLSNRDDVQQELHDEVDAFLADRDPTYAELSRLTLTSWVVMEGMRLYPPAYIIGRRSIKRCMVGPYRIPRKTIILMSQWVMHRHPEYFEAPDEFRPRRWENNFARKLPDYVYFPFSGGPRICIGSDFAMTEAILILATIMRSYRFQPDPGQEVAPLPSLTLRPRHGVSLIVHRRTLNQTGSPVNDTDLESRIPSPEDVAE